MVEGKIETFDAKTDSASTSLTCPDDGIVLAGGGLVTTTDLPWHVMLTGSYPTDPSTWTVAGAGWMEKEGTWTIQAWALCMPSKG